MFLLINAVDTTAKTFRVIGDVTTMLSSGSYIQVLKSTGNNGIYKLASVVYADGYTTLTTVEAIPSSTSDGNIAAGVYELTFSNSALPGKGSLIVAPWAKDSTTSLTFNGKASLNFGEYQQQNMLRVLENFASGVAPTNPTIGQHWYDATNSVIKVYTAAGWSSDINVEGGAITFKDPQHPVANTKYFLTAAEPTGKTGSGVTLYPAVNPTAGLPLFRIVDDAGIVIFEVDYSGKLISLNPLQVTATSSSTFADNISVNTAGGSATGLNVKNNVVVTTGNIQIDANKSILVSGGAGITLNSSVTLKGTAVAGGVVIQSTSGTSVATFADTVITFTQPLTATTITATTGNITTVNATTVATGTLSATGISTLNSVGATTLTVSGATALNGTVSIPTAPSSATHAVNKLYVDNINTSTQAQVQEQLIMNWIGI